MPKHPHILNAASNLLGIALLLIAGLNVSKASDHTVADEVTWVAAVFLTLSCLFSYLALRDEAESGGRFELWADIVFLIGLLLLVASMVVLATFGMQAG